MRECIEEGTLQAYLDHELSPEAAESVMRHIAACALCAGALSEAASELSLFATAFEAEAALEVPTARLRERIDAAITEAQPAARIFESSERGGFKAWLSSFVASLKTSPQHALGFASLIAVIAFGAIFVMIQSNRSDDSLALDGFNSILIVKGPLGSAQTDDGTTQVSPLVPPSTSTPVRKPKPDKKDLTKNRNSAQPQVATVAESRTAPRAPDYLPGETEYLKAIDSLTTEIEASGEANMQPSLLVEYKRNLAVVDQAIDSTRRAARRNPRDTDAAEFLYTSYQSKLDLLSTVAEQVRPTIAAR
jgi:hypothetical protein